MPSQTPAQALAALERFDSTHDDPIACEPIEIAGLMSEQERRLIVLVDGSSPIPAQASFRCGGLTQATLACNGVVADDAASPLEAGIAPLARPLSPRIAIVSRADGLASIDVYRASLRRLLDGKAQIKLQRRGDDTATADIPAGSVPIAIFRGPKPWIRLYTKRAPVSALFAALRGFPP